MNKVIVEPEELLQWVDGELDPARAEQVSLAVQRDAGLAQMTENLRASQLHYKEARDTIVPGVPEDVRDRVGVLLDESQSPARVSGLMVASLVAGMAVACLCGYLVGSNSANPVNSSSISASMGFAEAVASYQTFYVRETVEGTTNSNVNAVSTRLLEQQDLEVQVPDLSEQGYQFLRAQQLTFNGEPVVQLVYLAEEGLPVALCYMPLQSGSETKSDTAVFANYFGLNTVEWTTADSRIVIVSNSRKDHLKALHRSAVAQWQS